MEYLISGILVFLALSPVMIPFLRPSPEARPEPHSAELQDLLAEKQGLYAAIKELEFDHQAGKLALEDYQQTRRSYELRAVALLEQLDRLSGNRAGGDAGSKKEQGR